LRGRNPADVDFLHQRANALLSVRQTYKLPQPSAARSGRFLGRKAQGSVPGPKGDAQQRQCLRGPFLCLSSSIPCFGDRLNSKSIFSAPFTPPARVLRTLAGAPGARLVEARRCVAAALSDVHARSEAAYGFSHDLRTSSGGECRGTVSRSEEARG
jgi:hypothetical protein